MIILNYYLEKRRIIQGSELMLKYDNPELLPRKSRIIQGLESILGQVVTFLDIPPHGYVLMCI